MYKPSASPDPQVQPVSGSVWYQLGSHQILWSSRWGKSSPLGLLSFKRRSFFFLKERGEMCYHGDAFYMGFSEVAAAGLRKRIKLHFQLPKSWDGNQRQSSGKSRGAVKWQRQIISAAIKALVTFREKHIHQSLIETCKSLLKALINSTAALKWCQTLWESG